MAEKLFEKNRKQADSKLFRKYTVKKGDSLERIAKQFETTVDALAKANDMKKSDPIKEGLTLLIPGKAENKKSEKKPFTKAE